MRKPGATPQETYQRLHHEALKARNELVGPFALDAGKNSLSVCRAFSALTEAKSRSWGAAPGYCISRRWRSEIQ